MVADIPAVTDRKPIDGVRGIALLFLLLFGLSLAAVETMRLDCHDVYMTDDAGQPLLWDDGRQQCSLSGGYFRISLPAWTRAILGH